MVKNLRKTYHGTIVPLVTPFTTGLDIDERGVEAIFNHVYEGGATPFILGTTGESASVSAAQRLEYLDYAVKYRREGTDLYAGISSNCVSEAVDFALQCFDKGITAVAATLPSYYSLSTSQMMRYFVELADAIKGPLIIYNIPATTHMSIPLEVIDELSGHESIVGTKDSERSVERLDRSLALWRDRPDFSHFLGWAAQSAYALLNGSDGLVPSTGNLFPRIYQEMQHAAERKDDALAYSYQELSDAFGALYQAGRTLGESLYALKWLMSEYGLCHPIVMPPLQALEEEVSEKLVPAMNELLTRTKQHIPSTYNHG
jgi:dihydrodipicolinate synthase/N-acetylneuraminate lyase